MVGQGDPFDWSGGHPALDFVNTLDERPSDAPIENLASYDALMRFAELAGLTGPASERRRLANGPAYARIARRARNLREHLFAVIAANQDGQSVPQASLEAIAWEVRRAHAARAFAAGADGTIAHCWLTPTSPEVPLQACTLAVENLLVSTDLSRIRKCGATDCEVYFIDTSKAHRRQWCSMKNCGNRAKQRRWRSGNQ